MKTFKRIALALTLPIFLLGCAVKTGNKFLEKTNNEQISAFLIKGKTTKAEVRQKFGDPVDVDLLPEGRENWQYVFVRSAAKGINYLPIVNNIVHGTDDSITRLKILFDKKGKVEFFAFTHSKGETLGGAFQ